MPQKKNPDSLRTHSRQVRARLRRFEFALHDHEGLAGGLQAATCRRTKNLCSTPLNQFRAARFKWPAQSRHCETETRTRGAKVLEKSWVVATDWPRRWHAAGRRFIRPTRSPDGWCWRVLTHWQEAVGLECEITQAFAPEFTSECAAVLNPIEGMKTREIAGGHRADHVKAALHAAIARLDSLTDE